MPGTYRIEICPNNRAGCKDPVCKGKAEKIKKGELRFGSWVEYSSPSGETFASWSYKHWGCVSGAQIGTLRELCDMGDGEYDYNVIDGYDEIEDHPEIQEKVRRCIQQGHIDPEDFNGDPEKNKPGVKGIHLTAKQKEKRDREAAAAGDDATASEEDTKKAKPKAKRGRKKAEDEDEDEEPQQKKVKTAKGGKVGRKAAGVKVKDESDGETVAPPPAKGRKGAAKVKVEAEADETAAAPVAKKGRRATKVKKEESEPEEEAPQPVEKKAKRGRKSAVKAPTPESGDAEPKVEEEVEPEPSTKKKGRGSSTKATEAEADVKPKPKGRRRSSRTAS